MEEYKLTMHDEMDTIELAQNIESEKFPNMIICLNGELGSGKTIFTKGLAMALGIKDTITSPTFTIIIPNAPPNFTIKGDTFFRYESFSHFNYPHILKTENLFIIAFLLSSVWLIITSPEYLHFAR